MTYKIKTTPKGLLKSFLFAQDVINCQLSICWFGYKSVSQSIGSSWDSKKYYAITIYWCRNLMHSNNHDIWLVCFVFCISAKIVMPCFLYQKNVQYIKLINLLFTLELNKMGS